MCGKWGANIKTAVDELGANMQKTRIRCNTRRLTDNVEATKDKVVVIEGGDKNEISN